MVKNNPWRSHCPISMTLDILGDRWSLLIIRDVMFTGGRRFADFAASDEGIASNVLTERLQRLQEHGILSVESDPTDARRRLYSLTEKGWGLAPTLVEIVIWSAQHHDTLAPPAVVAAMRANRNDFIAALRTASLNIKQT